MSLSTDKLYHEFVRWFRTGGGVRTAEQAERRLAHAYYTYARDAEDVSGENPSNLIADKFERPLSFRRSGTRQQFARQIDAAFVAFWTDVAFPILAVPPTSPPCPNVGGSGEFSSEVSSQVVNVEAGAMYKAIMPILRSSGSTAERAARRLANAMDDVTKSAVTVLITGWDTTPGPSGPYPIINTCTVF